MSTNYNNEIGYSPLDCVDVGKMRNVIQVNIQIIKNYYIPKDRDLILVAGAGRGDEALLIQKEFGIRTFGIDLNLEEPDTEKENQEVLFQKQDLMSLAFKSEVFSLTYSYHVLEHVSNHMIVLQEIWRVLKPSGVLFIGFPNKNRLISYIGTSQKASIIEKFRWNLNDYSFRLRKKFENRYGAHAGFSEREFIRDASTVFDIVQPVRNEYMMLKYAKLRKAMQIIIKLKLAEFIFPSNYFICIKSRQ